MQIRIKKLYLFPAKHKIFYMYLHPSKVQTQQLLFTSPVYAKLYRFVESSSNLLYLDSIHLELIINILILNLSCGSIQAQVGAKSDWIPVFRSPGSTCRQVGSIMWARWQGYIWWIWNFEWVLWWALEARKGSGTWLWENWKKKKKRKERKILTGVEIHLYSFGLLANCSQQVWLHMYGYTLGYFSFVKYFVRSHL